MVTDRRSTAHGAARFAQRVGRSVKFRTSTRRAFVDVGRDPARAVIVLGSARSGTTKLAEILLSGGRTRFICEPLHFNSPFARSFSWGSYRDPASRDPALEDIWTRALTGAMRSDHTDRLNSARFSNRRVVKCIAGTNLASWLRVRYPDTPIVYIVRHPVATAKSIDSIRAIDPPIEWGWAQLQGQIVDDVVLRSGLLDGGPLHHAATAITDLWQASDTPFERNVLRWCLENALVLDGSLPSRLCLVQYEDLLTNPGEVLARLTDFTGLDCSRALESWTRSSRSDVNRRPGEELTAADRRDRWRAQVSTAELDAARRILEVFDLADGALGFE